jgi:hypothetical protein
MQVRTIVMERWRFGDRSARADASWSRRRWPDARAARLRLHGEIRDVLRRAPAARLGTQPDVVLLVAFLVLRDREPGDERLHGRRDVLHVQPQVGGLLAIDLEP